MACLFSFCRHTSNSGPEEGWMRERFLIGRKEGRRGPKGNIRRKYFILVDYSLSTRLIPSSEVSERSTNCHVFEPAYNQRHGTSCSHEGLFEGPSFVIPALLK